MVAKPSRSESDQDTINLPLQDVLALDHLCWLWRAGSDLGECMQLVLEKAAEATDSICGAIVARSSDQERFRALASSGLASRSIGRKEIEAVEAALADDLTDVIHMSPDSTSPLFSPVAKAGADSAIAIPIGTNGLLRGLILLGRQGQPYSGLQTETAESIAVYSARAIERAMACKEAEERAGLLESICQIGAQLVSERAMDSTLAVVVERAAALVNAESTAVGLMDEDGKLLRCFQAFGVLAPVITGMEFDTSEWPLSEVLKTGKSRIFHELSSDPKVRPKEVGEWGVHTALLAPLKVKNTVTGVLIAANKLDGRRFTAGDLRLFEALGNYAAVAIADSRLYSRMQETLVKLDAERAKLNGILTDLGDGVVVCDAEDRIILVNRAAEEIMDIHAEQVVGRSLVAFHPAEHRPMLTEILHRLKDPTGGEAALHETKINVGNKVVRINVSPVAVSGRYMGLAMVLQDITSLEEVGRAKTDFISTVAHELKTPLTSLRGSIGLMGGGRDLMPEFAQLLDIAENNLNRLVRLVDEMTDIANIEAGRMSLLLQPVSLYECAVDAVRDMQQVAARKSVSLMVRLVGAPPLVTADHDRMQQVMANLLSNAIRFSPTNGEVIVTVRHVRGYVRVSVQDFGAGIPRKDLKRVFDKFYQVGGPASRKDGGSGLGLAISKAIVDQHGGKIYARSAGQGSAFVFTVPIPAASGKTGETRK